VVATDEGTTICVADGGTDDGVEGTSGSDEPIDVVNNAAPVDNTNGGVSGPVITDAESKMCCNNSPRTIGVWLGLSCACVAISIAVLGANDAAINGRKPSEAAILAVIDEVVAAPPPVVGGCGVDKDEESLFDFPDGWVAGRRPNARIFNNAFRSSGQV
jgi:hypothetical protein